MSRLAIITFKFPSAVYETISKRNGTDVEVKLRYFVMKVLLNQIFLLCLYTTFILYMGCKGSTTQNLVNEALELAKIGGKDNWKRACRKLETCIKRGHTDPSLINLYVLSLEQIGKTDRAVNVAQQSLDQNPSNFALNYFLGRIALKNKRFRTALSYLTKCYNLRPNHIDTMILLVHCAEKVNVTYAAHLYSKFMDIDTLRDSYLIHNGLGVCYARQGEIHRAMSEFSQALKLSNGHPVVYLNMAVLCDRYMKKPSIAARYYSKYLEKVDHKFPEKSETVAKRLQKITGH